ncbi:MULTISPECIES: hypothetical protein [unclassified Mycolicibacterium]|uniref:hypothetical protein n=1 Tax=unclassified Mycolicibacterium TaxID=2636767 RepID=UPI002ED9ACD9
MDAIDSGQPILVADLAAAYERWSMFAYEAVAIGVAAMYALPLQVGAIQVGVLDLYRNTRPELAAIDNADGVAVADMVTSILLSGWIPWGRCGTSPCKLARFTRQPGWSSRN